MDDDLSVLSYLIKKLTNKSIELGKKTKRINEELIRVQNDYNRIMNMTCFFDACIFEEEENDAQSNGEKRLLLIYDELVSITLRKSIERFKLEKRRDEISDGRGILFEKKRKLNYLVKHLRLNFLTNLRKIINENKCDG